ncbi:hypothetical protein E2K98_14110 [Bacillus salipaludis]|uniref:Uncharacterized protein n=1 Tax=Bacillus salipaludis TaxID=2547811 RepID=A0A4R5VQP7_9BACI|nr:hypothetical protein [Bacillus salipaludis]MDQ6598596.1 hypothetical protein [Bacillus salipaludis]TDK60855.1 hypothetical protein E2K98_14110 [Bacillus salipaludis]
MPPHHEHHEPHDHHAKDEHHKSRKCSQRKCQKKINEILSSVAEIEKALANAINAETELLRREHLSPGQVSFLTEKLEELIRLAIKKEIILELLIQDAIKACEQSECHEHHGKK